MLQSLKKNAPKILILPDAGSGNPFQYQNIQLLKKAGFIVEKGARKKLGSIFISVLRLKPDLIYFDWVHSFVIGKTLVWSVIKSLAFLLELRFVRYKNIPIFHTIHNLQNHPGLWLPLERFVYGIFLRKCARLRVYSEEVKMQAVQKFRLHPDKVIVAQDPPYHDYYPNEVSKQESRDFLQLDNRDYVFLFFGMIKPYKGLEQLIQAFEQLQGEHIKLIIAGESDGQAYLESLQRLSGTNTGILWHHQFIPTPEVQYYFNAADMVVLPFRRIDHSGTVDLAMSFAKPIITLNTPTMSRLLSHQTHLLFNNPSELFDCMHRVVHGDLSEIGKANYELMRKQNFNHFLRLFYDQVQTEENPLPRYHSEDQKYRASG